MAMFICLERNIAMTAHMPETGHGSIFPNMMGSAGEAGFDQTSGSSNLKAGAGTCDTISGGDDSGSTDQAALT